MNGDDANVQLNDSHCARSGVGGGTGSYEGWIVEDDKGGFDGGEASWVKEQERVSREEEKAAEEVTDGQETEMEEMAGGGSSSGLELDASRQQPVSSPPRGASFQSTSPAIPGALPLSHSPKTPSTTFPLESGRFEGGLGGQALPKGGATDGREDSNEGGAERVENRKSAETELGKRSEEGPVRRSVSFSSLLDHRSDVHLFLLQYAVKREDEDNLPAQSSTPARSLSPREQRHVAEADTAQNSRPSRSRDTTSFTTSDANASGGEMDGDGVEGRDGGGGGRGVEGV